MNKKPLKKNEIFNLLKKIIFKKPRTEIINLSVAEGRILSSNIVSKINLPPFKNSAVDGYAIHKKDILNKFLKINHRIQAGDNKKIFLKSGEVARIFTGAQMPINCNTVVMQENTKLKYNNHIILKKAPNIGDNCRLAGEDVKIGQKILSSGQKINSTNINLIAAIGQSRLKVMKKLKVGYFTSGNEIKKISKNLKGSEINNSNKYSLMSLLKKDFIISKYLGVLKDSKKNIEKLFDKNLKKFDVIITTGGASVGEEDHLIDVLKEKGKIYFWKVAIKPGRPLAIGKIKNTIVICLPGNPVSVHLLFGMIIKPFLEFLSGSRMILPQSIKATANFTMRKKTERLEWLRVKIDKNINGKIFVKKYPKQGSGIISSVAFSDGLLEIPEKIAKINKGDEFDLYLNNYLY